MGSTGNTPTILKTKSAARGGVTKMTQVEYKIFSGVPKMTRGGQSIDWSAVEKSVNELVAEGWEVVSSNASSYGLLVVGCGSQEPVVTFVLRRPRQQ